MREIINSIKNQTYMATDLEVCDAVEEIKIQADINSILAATELTYNDLCRVESVLKGYNSGHSQCRSKSQTMTRIRNSESAYSGKNQF